MSPSLRRVAQLRLPLQDFASVTEALRDLAADQSNQHHEDQLPSRSHQQQEAFGSFTSSSASFASSDIAARLTSQIREVIGTRTSCHTDQFTKQLDDDSSELSFSLLAQELATISAIGFWADTFLCDRACVAVCRSLSSSMGTLLENHIPHPDMQASSLFPLSTPADARRSVFRMALRKRYGRLEDGPLVMSSVGAPYVLYVLQQTTGVLDDMVARQSLTTLHSLQNEMRGLAVVEHVSVSAEEVTRATIVAKLKDAVFKRALSPTLMVVDAQLDGTLSAASGLLRAVCDTYGMHMHVEGNALPMILTGTSAKSLFYNVGDLIDAAHTTTLDIAKWYGNYNTAVLLHCKDNLDQDLIESPGAPGDLTACMSIWYLLHRVRFPLSANALLKACEYAAILVDTMDRLPNLFECRTIGCGEIVLISSSPSRSTVASLEATNRAMFWDFQRCHTDLQSLLTLTRHDNREWLRFIPSHAMHCLKDSGVCSAKVLLEICKDLACAIRKQDVVLKGRAAFISELRQCHDIEVEESSSPRDASDGLSALFYAAVRVTPFGEVSRNGHWKGDEEMAAIVFKYTHILGEVLREHFGKELEVVLHSSKDVQEVIYIGPTAPDAGVAGNYETESARASSAPAESVSVGTITACDEAWDLDEVAAQSMASKVADRVISAVRVALSYGHRATSEPTSFMKRSNSFEASDTKNNTMSETAPAFAFPATDHDQKSLVNTTCEDKDKGLSGDHLPPSSAHLKANVNAIGPYEDDDKRPNAEKESEDGALSSARASHIHDPTSKDADTVKPRTSFWGAFFRSDSPEETKSNSSTESPQLLEDDYFRP